jgi:hypothetical protein
MAKKEKTAIAKPTQQDIDRWKQEYDEVHVLKVGDKTAYLHDPDMLTTSLAMSKIANRDVFGSALVILENCWLGGDEEIKRKPKYISNSLQFVNAIIEEMDASMEKL